MHASTIHPGRLAGLLAFLLLTLLDSGAAERSARALPAGSRDLPTIRRDLQHYRQRLEQQRAEEQTLLARLDALSRRQDTLHQELEGLRQQLQASQHRLQRLDEEQKQYAQQLRAYRQRVAQRLRALYKRGRLSTPALLLSAPDLAAFIHRRKYLQAIAAYDQQQLRGLQDALRRAAEVQQALAAETQRLKSYQARLRQQQAALAQEREHQQRLLHELRQDRARAARMVEELEAAARLLTRAFPEVGDSRPGSLVPGQLLWPVHGAVLVSFGRVALPHLNVSVTQKGVHIGAPLGSEVRACAAGKVVYVGSFQGFGRVLVLDHGQHLMSLYGHTSEVLVRVGEWVQQGQVIAKVGMSSLLGEPALYLEIRHRTVPQDPLRWLRRRAARLREPSALR